MDPIREDAFLSISSDKPVDQQLTTETKTAARQALQQQMQVWLKGRAQSNQDAVGGSLNKLFSNEPLSDTERPRVNAAMSLFLAARENGKSAEYASPDIQLVRYIEQSFR